MKVGDRYAVFGNPVGHSQSPRIHKLFAEQTAQRMSYEAVLVALDGFAEAAREFAATGGKGANVTVPFKEEAFRLATRLTSRAQAAGAVNTLRFDQGDILGDNTDGAGLVRDITNNLGHELNGARVLLIGAGGAARGALMPLQAAGPRQIVVVNRTASRAERMVREVRAPNGLPSTVGEVAVVEFDMLQGMSGFDIVINATSAGLTGAALALPDAIFAPEALAYEMLYGRETGFMAQAHRLGVQVFDGLGMLVEQAAEAFFVWRGIRPDTQPVLAALRTSIAMG